MQAYSLQLIYSESDRTIEKSDHFLVKLIDYLEALTHHDKLELAAELIHMIHNVLQEA